MWPYDANSEMVDSNPNWRKCEHNLGNFGVEHVRHLTRASLIQLMQLDIFGRLHHSVREAIEAKVNPVKGDEPEMNNIEEQMLKVLYDTALNPLVSPNDQAKAASALLAFTKPKVKSIAVVDKKMANTFHIVSPINPEME